VILAQIPYSLEHIITSQGDYGLREYTVLIFKG